MSALVERVQRAMFESWCKGGPGRNGEAYARAAIAEVFDWLDTPSEEAWHACNVENFEAEPTSQDIWQAMLNQMRKDAGI